MSAHDSPDGTEPYSDPSHSHLHDDHLNEFLRAINMQGSLPEPMFPTQTNTTPSSHPIQIPLPDPPVIVPSQPLPAIENQPIYLQNAYPETRSPQQHEYSQLDYNLGPWEQQQSPRTVQFPISNATHPDEHSWQTSQSYSHPEAVRRQSGEYPSPHYQTTPSPAADLSPLPLTPGGVSRSLNSRGNRAAHAAPYDPSVRRVSAPPVHRIMEEAVRPAYRTPSPARMPPPITVPQRSAPTTTKKRSRAGTGGDPSSNTGRSKKTVPSDQTQSSASGTGSQTKYPSQLQISPPSATSPTIPSYTSHSPVQSSPLVSAPVILPPQSLSPAAMQQQVSPHSLSVAPAGAGHAHSSEPSRIPSATDSLLMSTHPTSSAAVNSSSFSSSSESISSSAVPSSLSSSLYASTSSGSIPRAIPIEAQRGPQQIPVRPQGQSQRSQLRQLTPSVTPSRRGAPYPQSASARLAYQQATKSARATYLQHITSTKFLGPEALLPSMDPHTPRVRHATHHPLAPWLTTDINTAEHIPADMRYDAHSHTLLAVLALPGVEEDKIAVTLEDVHFNRNRILYVSAYTAPTFPWHDEDVNMAQHSEAVETIADAEEEARKREEMGKGKSGEVGTPTVPPSGGETSRNKDSSGSPSEPVIDAPESTQDPSSTPDTGTQTQPPTADTTASPLIRMGHTPNIRELIYGRQMRVINVPPSTQPKDVTVTLTRGLLYIQVDMGEPLTTETATRNLIPISSPSTSDPTRPRAYPGPSLR